MSSWRYNGEVVQWGGLSLLPALCAGVGMQSKRFRSRALLTERFVGWVARLPRAGALHEEHLF